jgi:hypothetical protein
VHGVRLSWFRSRQDRVLLFRSLGVVATLQGKQRTYTGELDIGEVIDALGSIEFHYSIASLLQYSNTPILQYSNTYISLIGRS